MKYKRLICLLMAIIMTAALLPVAALAEENDPTDPAESPVSEPAEQPTEQPTEKPTEKPAEEPTEKPTEEPTVEPTEGPTEKPTEEPTAEPTEEPAEKPTAEPTETPTVKPTETPTEKPTEKPTEAPVATSKPEPKLVVKGGTFEYDGKSHTVSAKVENGTGYTVEYSTDGKNWSSDAPGRKEAGKTTVKVRAIKSGAETLTGEATIEITAKDVQIVTIVNCKNSVNVRKGASSKTAKIGTAPKGAKYRLLEVDGYWYKIQYKSNVTGYVYIDYVKTGKGTPSEDEPEPEPSGDDQIVTIVNCKTACNVRNGGSTSYAKIGTAPKGSTYQYLGKSGNYYKIQYTASKVGYVHKNYAKVSKGSATPDPDDPPSSGQIVTIVNCKLNCNVRKAGSQSSKKIGVAPRDKQYQYLGKSGNYYKIQYTSSTVGYVHMSYAKVSKGSVTPDSSSKDKNQGTIVNCKNMVNVRAEASSSSKLLGTIKLGSKVTIVKTVGNWTKIKYNGGEAYVFSKYVKKG